MVDPNRSQHDIDATADESFWQVLSGQRPASFGNSSEARAAALRDVYLRRTELTDALQSTPPTPESRAQAPARTTPVQQASASRSASPRRWLDLATAACVAGLIGVLVGHLWSEPGLNDRQQPPPARPADTEQQYPEPRPSGQPAGQPDRSVLPEVTTSDVWAPKGDASPLESGDVDVGSDFVLGTAVGTWLTKTLDACNSPADTRFDWVAHAARLSSLAHQVRQRTPHGSPVADTIFLMDRATRVGERTDDSIRRTLCSRKKDILYAIQASDSATSRAGDTG